MPIADTTTPEILLALAGMVAVTAILAVLTRRLRVPLAVILVLVGFVAGEVSDSAGLEVSLEGERFREIVTFVFLPILVFEAALAIPARSFFKDLPAILALAVPALGVSAALVAAALHFGLAVTLATALLFGVLISATDPVAVTAVFRQLGVPRRLLVLLEGESLLNDGIAIVLFQILIVAALGTGTVSIAGGALEFLEVTIGGAAVGLLIGGSLAEFARRLGRLPSTALTFAVAFGSFVLAEEILGFSGVIAAVTAGLVLSAFSKTLIPKDELGTWHKVWETLAFVANGLLFLLIGIALEAGLFREYWASILVAIAAVLLARPIAVFGVIPTITRLGWMPSLGRRGELVLIWGGLRGGVALALALSIPAELVEQ